jgi:uncharacterized protein YjiS (DUF1127 family)
MSCGSTIGNSTNNLKSDSHSFPDLKWLWSIPVAWLIGIALRWERRRQCSELLDLDDHLLADIGLSRTDLEEVRRQGLYLIGWHDSR